MTLDDRLQDIFRSVMEDDALVLTDSMTAADVPAWDSVAHVTLMFTIESEFGLEFDDEQLSGFATVGELREFVRAQATA